MEDQPKKFRFESDIYGLGFVGFNVKKTTAEEEKLWGWQTKSKSIDKKMPPVKDASNPAAKE